MASKQPKLTTITITPARAKKMLAQNWDRNRRLDKIKVSAYVADILAGNWKYIVGESIKFNVSGQLVDGQHRLQAIVQSGKSVKIDVIENFPDELVPFLDQGKARTLADNLGINGVDSYAAGIGASITWCIKYDMNKWHNIYPTRAQALEYREANPELDEYVRFAYSHKFGKWTKQVIAVTAYLTDRVTGDDTGLNFWETYMAKKDLSDAQAVLARWAENNLGGRERIGTYTQLGVAMKALNAHRRGDELKTIFFRGKGERAESFPRVEGELIIVKAEDVPDYFPKGWHLLIDNVQLEESN